MSKRAGIAVVVIVLAAIGGALWWKQRGGGAPGRAPAVATDSAGSATSRGQHPRDAARAPAHLVVTVRGPAGPLEGATVRLSQAAGEVVIAQTGANGEARSDALEPGTWSVSASAPGHEPAALPARELAAGETVRLELALASGGRTLSGVVTDATGGPIAGARIDAAKLTAMVRPTDAVASTLTAADGTYTLTVPAPGPLLVAASEASYAPQSRYIEVGPEGATASFQLVPGGVIEGIVRDERTREPVGGATVEATRDAPAMLLGERSRLAAQTAADGRFRITGLRPGAYLIDARAGDRVSRGATAVGLGVAEQITDIEILVAGAPSIRGTVVDEAGTPVAGATITRFGGGRGDQDEVTSDGSGAFVIAGVQPGRYMLVGRGPELLPAGTLPVEVDTQDVTGVKVLVRRGARVTGHVEPRQSCEVRIEPAEPSMQEMMFLAAPATTGADGQFTLGPVGQSSYQVDARCPTGDQGSLRVTVAPGMGEVVVPVKPGASIAGRVVDRAGKPLAAVTVMASQQGDTDRTTIVNGMITSGMQTLTSATGEFVVRGLAAGTYRLGVLERGRPLPMANEPTVTVAAAEAKTGITLSVDRPDGVIQGVVTGPDGAPLAEAWVSLHVGVEDLLAARAPREGGGSRIVRVESTDDGSGDAGAAIAPVLTDARGAFQFTGLARIPMTVVAEANGGALRGQQQRVVPDATITLQALGLTELRGTVRSSGPAAVTWFTVELDGPTREQRSFAAADGTFVFSRVDPGRYQVRVTSSAGNGEATVTVVAGQPATVEIVLAANAIVVGKVVDASGKPLGGMPVAVVPDEGERLRVSLEGPPPTTSADGSFRVEAKAGKSAVLVLTPGRPTSKRGVLLEAGKTFDAGTITVEAGTPPPPP